MSLDARTRRPEGRGGPAIEPAVGLPSRFGLRITLQILVVLVALGTALWILYRIEGILFLLFLAILFGYVLSPLIELLRRPIHLRGRAYALPLPGAIAFAYVLLFGSVATAVVLLLPAMNEQLTELMRTAPSDLARVQSQWEVWQKGHTRVFPRSMRAGIDRAVQTAVASAGEYLKTNLLPRIGVWLARLPWLVLVPILTFFFVKDAELFRRAFLEELSGRRLRRRGDALFEDISRALAAYVRAQVLACAIVGIVCTAGFLAIGLPYAVVFGLLAGLMEFIPLAGPLTIALLSVGVAAFQSPAQALTVLAFLLVLRIIQDYVVYPRLVGREVQLHPLAVILAILCGGELAGVAGIFAAVPVLTVLVVSYRHWKRHRQLEAAAPSETAVKSA